MKAELDVSQTKIDNLEWVKEKNNNQDSVYIYASRGQCSAAKFALVILITQLKDNEQLEQLNPKPKWGFGFTLFREFQARF